MQTELVVSNVRVLAMGQTVETKNGEAVVTGATSTLELDPHQAELVLLAQRTGSLSLALRPLVDAHPKDDTAETQPASADNAMTISSATASRPVCTRNERESTEVDDGFLEYLQQQSGSGAHEPVKTQGDRRRHGGFRGRAICHDGGARTVPGGIPGTTQEKAPAAFRWASASRSLSICHATRPRSLWAIQLLRMRSFGYSTQSTSLGTGQGQTTVFADDSESWRFANYEISVRPRRRRTRASAEGGPANNRKSSPARLMTRSS